ncbi:PTS galactitol transporter subunit IIC [uncultured Dubosiella sp.]|uniref:PTS galactitol transporter subunit IIC n=1 Tax=uncultured Dubosiella sp. TaxID=1937011 RepID=UPI0025B316E4|nr:PTS transporter subunit IIC [uncultured Dubosiella sp.]
MSVITNAIQFIIDLGPTVMMPILITLIGVCIRVPFLRALKGGLLVGIGFIGLNATVTILTDVVQPAVDNMVKLFGLNLTVIDVGWPSASAIAFGTAVGVTMIPLGILINVIMLLTKSTKTVDVDIWDFWHFAFSGSIVYALTHNMFLSLILASVNMVVIMVIADRMAKATEEVLGLPGITFPHGLAASFVPIAWVMDKAIDKVPGLNKIHLDEKTINKKMGLFGDPAILGLIVGVLLGVAGFAFMPELSVSEKISQILVMGVTVSAVLVITPKMAAILMEGIIPVSEGIQAIIQKKFAGRKVYIGLDCAAGIGHPVVLAMSVLMVPVTLLLAIVLPGNEFLPLVGLCGICFQFPLIVAVTKGDFFRTFLIGVVVMGGGLMIGTSLAPLFTSAAAASHFPIPEGATLISSIDYGSNPIPWLLVHVVNNGWIWIALLIVATLGLAMWNRKKILEEEKLDAAADAEKQKQREARRAARKAAAKQTALEETELETGLQDA